MWLTQELISIAGSRRQNARLMMIEALMPKYEVITSEIRYLASKYPCPAKAWRFLE